MANYAADDADYIARKMKEIAEERAHAERLRSPEFATCELLDMVAQDFGLKREMGESDYTFRGRVMTKKREQEALA